ncbi:MULTISPECIES: spore germination protein [unclassified Sporolactobacillus]|uniref:spore germination protein n=1 Tax=unclassified Sporolactobacillus TaxID=2628533 RepID=UPI00236758F4|nr:spore germination protein [Sporolactobacillus sp. CQH2019]MDD9150636.1 spore germination protein [Sporolactobacillus sp. CQH2019]
MFKIIKNYFRNQKTKQKAGSARPVYADTTYPLSKSLDRNTSELKKVFGDSDDLIFREFYFGVRKQIKALVFFIDGLGDQKLILDSIVKSLMVDIHIIDAEGRRIEGRDQFNEIKKHLLTINNAEEVHDFNEAVESVLSGNTCLLIDGSDAGLSISTRGGERRAVEEASNEIVIRGSHEAFVETLRTNTSMLRRIIKNPNLTFEPLVLGKQTHTDICIAYIRGIANNRIVEEVRRRLHRIDIDSVMESGYIEQLIEDSVFSPFATIGNSERPDKVAAKLLEGRVAILCSGTPVVLTVPYLLIEAFQVPDDYYSRVFNANITRLVRFVGFAITLTLPALYVAVTTFHQEMIPTILLVKLTAAREGIPFPVIIEALISETIFLLIRESGIRMPRAAGTAVTIVGTLVMGDAAVTAGIISAPMVIITALSGLAGMMLPAIYNAIVLFRYFLILLGGSFGLYGVVIGLICLLAHLCSLRSFGTPFMTPFAPVFWNELRDDTFLRLPTWMMKRRPQSITWKRSERQADLQKPGPRRK